MNETKKLTLYKGQRKCEFTQKAAIMLIQLSFFYPESFDRAFAEGSQQRQLGTDDELMHEENRPYYDELLRERLLARAENQAVTVTDDGLEVAHLLADRLKNQGGE